MRKTIYVANMTEDEFEEKNTSVGGRVLKEYLGIKHVYGVGSIKELNRTRAADPLRGGAPRHLPQGGLGSARPSAAVSFGCNG